MLYFTHEVGTLCCMCNKVFKSDMKADDGISLEDQFALS